MTDVETDEDRVLVEILSRSGWTPAGKYRRSRATDMVAALEAEGAIARADGQFSVTTRLEWSQVDADDPDVYVGIAQEDMRLFVLSAVINKRAWVLRSAVPGDTASVRTFEDQETGKDAAERVFLAFIRRMKAL